MFARCRIQFEQPKSLTDQTHPNSVHPIAKDPRKSCTPMHTRKKAFSKDFQENRARIFVCDDVMCGLRAHTHLASVLLALLSAPVLAGVTGVASETAPLSSVTSSSGGVFDPRSLAHFSRLA